MYRASLITLALLALTLNPSWAQVEPAPSVTIAGANAKAAGEVLKRILAAQKFKVSATDHRILRTQDRGRVPQATGEVLRVRLEVGIRVDKRPDSLQLTIADETLIAERTPGLEQRRPQNFDRNRASYQKLLTLVKVELEGGAPRDSAVRGDSSTSAP